MSRLRIAQVAVVCLEANFLPRDPICVALLRSVY